MTVSVPSNQQSSPYQSLHPRAGPRSAEPEGPGPAPIDGDAVPVDLPVRLSRECLGPRLVQLRIGLVVGPVIAFQYPEISTGRIQSSLPWLLHFGTRAAQNRGHKRVRHCRHAPFPPKREAADPQAFAVHQPSSSPHGTARRETGPKWIALALDPFSRSRPRPLFALLP